MKNPKKLIKDGKVAVIISPGYGAGWSTWADTKHEKEMLFDRGLAQLVEARMMVEARNYAKKKWPNEYLGGLKNAVVRWIDKGTLFKVVEYDGSESIERCDKVDWIVA